VASRPLRVEELAEFLAFDFDVGPIPKFREKSRLEDPVYGVLSTCSSLLSIVDVEDFQAIQFSHFSVKEFLTSTRLAETNDTTVRRYHISMTSAHTVAAQACLGILLHLDKDITRDRLRRFPLSEYAAKHWVDHARFEHVMPNVEEGMKRLFDPNKPHLAIWVWICDPADLWHTDERGERPPHLSGTSLHYAAICGFHVTTKYLINEHSLDINARGVYKESTPLHQASDKGHVEVVRVLLEHGADVTAQNEDELTPLHRASRSGREEIVRVLLEHGADPAARDKNRMTPLHWASARGHVEVARILLERSEDAEARDKDGRTPLHYAAFEGRVDIARILLKHGVDATVQDKDGRTPLHRSSSEGHLEVTRLLLKHGVDATATDNDGRTVLHRASIGGHVKVVRFLLDHGVDTTIRDKNGWTPLHHASRGGHLKVTRVFLEHGADETIQDKNGDTPTNLALQRGHIEVARILLDHGNGVTASASATDASSGNPSRERRVRNEHVSLKMQVSDFAMMCVLGKGSASKVLLVRHKSSSELYALKTITKRRVLARQVLQYMLTEQAVLRCMATEGTNPFVVKLWWSFHDKENIFLVMVCITSNGMPFFKALGDNIYGDRTSTLAVILQHS
jgi:ankyrin repeat protein